MSLEPGSWDCASDGHDLRHMPTLRAPHNFYGPGVIMPLRAAFSIRKKLRVLCYYCIVLRTNTLQSGLYPFFFLLISIEIITFPGLPKVFWAVDSVPIVTYGNKLATPILEVIQGKGKACGWHSP